MSTLFGNVSKMSHFTQKHKTYKKCGKFKLHFLFRKPISDYLWYTRIELIFHTRFFLSVSIQFGRDFRDRIGVTISLFRKGVRFKEVQYTFFAFFLCFCSSRVIGRFFPLLAFTSVYFPLRWPLVLFWWHF